MKPAAHWGFALTARHACVGGCDARFYLLSSAAALVFILKIMIYRIVSNLNKTLG
jgi:hypothetical protein